MAGGHHRTGSESASRAFPATTAITSLVYNLLVALACAYLPEDHLYIAQSIQVYAAAGSLLSVFGLVGVATRRSALTTPFAHFLLLDTFVSAIVRLLILQFFFDAFYDHNVCTSAYDPAWNPRNFKHDIVTSVRYQREYLWQSGHRRGCRVALGAVQVVLVGLLICLTAAQASLAVIMRRFGKELERRKSGRTESTGSVARLMSATEKPRRSPEPTASCGCDEKPSLDLA